MTAQTMRLFSIDTLQFSKRLQKAGLEKRISEELAEAIKESQNQSIEGLATKADLELVRKDIKILEQKFDGKFENIEQKFENFEQKFENFEQKFQTLENRLTIKMFVMLTAAVGIITWLDKVIA